MYATDLITPKSHLIKRTMPSEIRPFVVSVYHRHRSACASSHLRQAWLFINSLKSLRACAKWIDQTGGQLIWSYALSHYMLRRIWTEMRENILSVMWIQRRLKSACASAQSDQNLRCLHEKKTLYLWLSKMCPDKILIRLRECASWSESSLDAHVWRYAFWRCNLADIPVIRHWALVFGE